LGTVQNNNNLTHYIAFLINFSGIFIPYPSFTGFCSVLLLQVALLLIFNKIISAEALKAHPLSIASGYGALIKTPPLAGIQGITVQVSFKYLIPALTPCSL
jgi:hypothetical protein